MGEYTGTFIPKYIMENRELHVTDKFLYAEIASFNECFAGNDFFAARLNMSLRGVEDAIRRLKEAGLIKAVAFDGRKRKLLAIQNHAQTWSSTVTERGAAPRSNVDIDNTIENNIDIKTKAKDSLKQNPYNPDIDIAFINWIDVYGFTPKQPTSERREAKKLIKQHGLERVSGAIRAAYAAKDIEYAPVITSFKDLWYKWDKLESFYRRKQKQTNQSVTITE